MCGRCRQVFNAFQSLSRVDDLPEKAAESPKAAPAKQGASVANIPPTDSLDVFFAPDATAEPVADSLFLREEPLPLPTGFTASSTSALGPLPAKVLPTPSVASASGPTHVDEGRALKTQLALRGQPVLPEPAIDLSVEDPPMIVDPVDSVRMPALAHSRAWGVGAFMLFVGLSVQAAYAFRSTIVSNYPQLRPTFTELCAVAGCSVSWGRDETALKIEASELLTEASGKPGRILLTAILVNRGKTKQDLPSLELRLTDNANQVVASRLLHPADYLGHAVGKDEGLVPNTELYVNVNLEIGNKAQASGYTLLVFYP